MRLQNYYAILFLFALLFGCSEETIQTDNLINGSGINTIGSLEIVSNKIKFNNKNELKNFINDQSEEDFTAFAINLRKSGFKSLTPVFMESETKERQAHLSKKKESIKLKGLLFTHKNSEDSEIELDDELIQDSRFAALLNEDREMIVGDSIYVFTTRGLFYSKVEDEDDLRNYLLSLETKMNISKNVQQEPCFQDYDTPQNISYFQDPSCGEGGSGGGGYTGGSTPTSYNTFPIDKNRNLTVCKVAAESLWQQIFGAAETCHDYFADDRRSKTVFWNQNYFIFSSIGMKVKHQKRNWGIWDASNATDYIELGISNVSFKYNFNTQVYDDIFRNIQSDVIITWKGKTYTSTGRIIYGYPLQASSLPLDASDNASIGVYFFNRNITIIDEQQANNIIRDAARSFISSYGSSLETPVYNTNNNLSIDGVIIDPLANSITYTLVGKTYRSLNASSIEKTLDFNILVGIKLNLTGGSYSTGVNGPTYNSGVSTTYDTFMATSYTDVTLDMYGVVRRDGNIYRGNRMIANNLD